MHERARANSINSPESEFVIIRCGSRACAPLDMYARLLRSQHHHVSFMGSTFRYSINAILTHGPKQHTFGATQRNADEPRNERRIERWHVVEKMGVQKQKPITFVVAPPKYAEGKPHSHMSRGSDLSARACMSV